LLACQGLAKVSEEFNFLKEIKSELNSFKSDNDVGRAAVESQDPDVWGPPPPKNE
jgi:hypothetical protein